MSSRLSPLPPEPHDRGAIFNISLDSAEVLSIVVSVKICESAAVCIKYLRFICFFINIGTQSERERSKG